MVRLLALAAPLALAAALAAPAGADVFCVHQGTGCPVGAVNEGADLQEALDDAAAAPGKDDVVIGPGTFDGPFAYAHPSALDITGAGADATTLTAPDGGAAGGRVLAAGGANVSRLAVRIPVTPGWRGITAGEQALLSEVVVAAKFLDPMNDDALIGVELDGEAGLRDSAVTVAAGVAVLLQEGGHVVSGSTIAGSGGLRADPSTDPTVVRRSSVTGSTAVQATDSRILIDNSVVRVTGNTGRGLEAHCGPNPTPALIRADHVTVIGPGPGMGVFSHCAGGGQTTIVNVTNSIIRGFERAFRRQGVFGGTADVYVEYADLENVASSTSSGTGSAKLSSIVDVDPLLAADGHRLRTGSPLIDAGAPGAADEPIDFGGGARLIGDRQDIGADEYDPADPPPDPEPGTPPGGAAPPAAGAPLAPGFPGAPAGKARSSLRADLLAELRRTLARRRGRTYRHRFLVPGTLRIKWAAGSRVVAQLRLQRSRTGVAKARIKVTRRGRRMLRSVRRVRVYGSFAPTGGRAVRATRRARLRR